MFKLRIRYWLWLTTLAVLSVVHLPASALEQPKAAASAPADMANDEIAGTVLDDQGNPLSDVLVDAWHWSPGNETKTDEQGRFRLKALDAKRKVEVRISKAGYSSQYFPQQPTGVSDWVIRLNQKTYLEGTVTGIGGQRVAGADIRASFGPVQGDGVVITEVTSDTKSGEDGTYRLYLSPAKYEVQVSAGQRGVFRVGNIALKQDESRSLSFQLQKGVDFEARITDSASGDPVQGFVLWQWRPPFLVSRSDVHGKIVLDGLIPGKIEFNCGGGNEIIRDSGIRFYEHGRFGRWWSADATSTQERFFVDESRKGWQRNFDRLHFDLKVGMQPVNIVVEKGVTITGRVTDPKGNPVDGATVAPALTGTGNSITGDTRYSVSTDKEGNYEVVLPASNKTSYNLVAHDGQYDEWRNFANGVSEPIQTNPGQMIKSFNLQLNMPAVIRGQVIVDGRGVGNRGVRTHAFDKRENRYYDPTTQTKEDGTFELSFVRPGKHYLQAEPFWLSAENAPLGSKIIDVKAGEVLEGIELIAGPMR
jgi:hypothetical protein